MAKATITLTSSRKKDVEALETIERMAAKLERNKHDTARRLIMAGAKAIER